MLYLSLATGHCNINKATGVEHPLPSAAFGRLFLLLWFDFWGLISDFAGTRERSVNFTHVGGLLVSRASVV